MMADLQTDLKKLLTHRPGKLRHERGRRLSPRRSTPRATSPTAANSLEARRRANFVVQGHSHAVSRKTPHANANVVTPSKTSKIGSPGLGGPRLARAREQTMATWPHGVHAARKLHTATLADFQEREQFFRGLQRVGGLEISRRPPFNCASGFRSGCRRRQMDASRRQDGFTADGYALAAHRQCALRTFRRWH